MKRIKNFIIIFIKKFFKQDKNEIKNIEINNNDKEWEAKKLTAKTFKNTPRDDNRIATRCIIRNLNEREIRYLNSIYSKKNICIRSNNYYKYSFGEYIYNNTMYSFIPLYYLDKSNKYNYKYLLIYRHPKSSDRHGKFKKVASFYLDLNKEPFYGSYIRIYKNKKFITKLWKKVESKLKNK